MQVNAIGTVDNIRIPNGVISLNIHNTKPNAINVKRPGIDELKYPNQYIAFVI